MQQKNRKISESAGFPAPSPGKTSVRPPAYGTRSAAESSSLLMNALGNVPETRPLRMIAYAAGRQSTTVTLN